MFESIPYLIKSLLPRTDLVKKNIDTLLQEVPTDTPKEAIKNWYNGYQFGGQVVYNPWSMMCFLADEGQLDPYWIDSGGTGLVEKAVLSYKVQQDLQTLVKGGSIVSTIAKQIRCDTIEKPEGLYNLLLFSGYLNAVQEPEQRRRYQLSIPNHEVREIYNQWLIDWITQLIKESNSNEVYDLAKLLVDDQIEAFKEKLQDMVLRSMSSSQTAAKGAPPEVVFNAFVLGAITASLPVNLYIVNGEEQTGLGRADLMLVPKNITGRNRAIIIEYKRADKPNKTGSLDNLAQEALAQIDEKLYMTSIKNEHDHIQCVRKMGIAIRGKEMTVLSDLEAIQR